jgi:excinuclease ABC subunit B
MSTTIVADSKSSIDRRKKEKLKKTSISDITEPLFKKINNEQRRELIEQLRREMVSSAKDLEFERAAELRDEINRLNDEK